MIIDPTFIEQEDRKIGPSTVMLIFPSETLILDPLHPNG